MKTFHFRDRKPARGGRGIKDFWRDRKAASALEFALLALPTILLLLGILEVALVYVGTFSLEEAVDYGARLVRTGQAQDWDATTFKNNMCTALVPPLTCSGLQVDVTSNYDSFNDVTSSDPLNADGSLKNDFSYNPGGSGQIVVVRAYYDWPLIAKFPKGIALSNMANGDRLLEATAVFRNEPF